MWCPMCKKAFSWTSGLIETKAIHNPHYYEFLRNTQGFVPRTDTCADRLPIEPVRRASNEYYQLFRTFAYIVEGMSTRWDRNAQEEQVGERSLKFMRVEYLANDLTEQQWKKSLQMRHKAVRKSKAIMEVIDALETIGIELLNDANTEESVIMNRMWETLLYFNKVFEKISKKFNCLVPYVEADPDFVINCMTKNHRAGR